MTRRKPSPTPPPTSPTEGAKAVTFALLLDTAMGMIRDDGHIPSVAEVASQAQVSRATAYRYFPSRNALVTAIIHASLGPVRSTSSDNPDGQARVTELFERTFPRFKEYEPQLRAAAQLAMEQWALHRAGRLQEAPYRRGHRVAILAHALAPLAPQLTPALQQRLHHALSVIYGIEPHVILKEVWDLKDRDVERTALWMAHALVEQALRESAAEASARP